VNVLEMLPNPTPLDLTLWGLAGCAFVMTIAWAVALRLKFLSLVDAVWALGIGACAAAYHFYFGAVPLRSLLSVAIVLLWSLRLGGHLSLRLAAHFPKEDSRYVKLKSSWSTGLRAKSFVFFQFQALTQALFAYPFAVTALDGSDFPRLNEIVGFALALVGILGESVSDRQLKRFKADKSNAGKVCDVGLWRYSRHPNYFFEWVVWCGFGALALAGPMGAWALVCPLAMLLLLLFVTGVAPSERQSLRSRGQAYVRYQQTTSRFVPWFPKKAADAEGRSSGG
jgi:steroid 5-alpha reductase family enzyme